MSLSLSHTLIEPILCQAPGARLPTARSVTVAASKHRPVRFIFALPARVCVTWQTDRDTSTWRSATATQSPSRGLDDMDGARPHSVDFAGLPSLGGASVGSKSPVSVSDASTGLGADDEGGAAREYTNAEHTATALWS